MRGSRLCLVVAIVAAGPPAGPAHAGPAPAAPSSPGGSAAALGAAPDFDGDGYGDLVVGNPHDSCRRPAAGVECGSATIFYGGADGLVLSRSQTWDQGSPGVPGPRDAYDLFGFATATGDLDADGFDDLAVGIPYDRGNDAGSVVVLYGSPGGLSGDRGELWSPRSPDVQGVSRHGDQFGRSVAIGDVDSDSYPDLVVGSWSSERDRSAVHVLPGSDAGITAERDERRDGRDGGHSAQAGYGRALAVADFDADGFGDIAVGVEWAAAGAPGAGAVEIVPGSATGMDSAAARTISQATTGVLGTPSADDALGADLDAADFDGDGFADLAAGAPGDDEDEDDAGAVNILYGSAGGIAADGNQLWTTPATGAAAVGAALTTAWAGDLDRDGRADLVLAAPGRYGPRAEDIGVVGLLLGSARGLTAVGGSTWSGDPGGYFGGAVTASDVNADGFPEMSVGAPLADVVGSKSRLRTQAGEVYVYAGGDGGPGSDPLLLTQSTSGVPGPMRSSDRFGETAP